MKKLVTVSLLYIFLVVARVFIALAEGIYFLWNRCMSSDLDVWKIRIQRFGLFIASAFLAFFGVQVSRQSFNSPDSGTVCVVFIFGILVVVMAIGLLIKFMPRQRSDVYRSYP
jgi:hypothetical protein